MKGSFRVSDRSELLAASRLSLITSHQPERRKRLEEGGAAQARQRGEPKPKEGSILIKGPGAEPWLKIETEGRLASISAGVDGPIDSSTGASGS